MGKEKKMVSVTQVKNNKVKILNDETSGEEIQTKKHLIIMFRSGQIKAIGDEKEVERLVADIRHKDKRHLFINVKDYLTCPEVGVIWLMPCHVEFMIIQDISNIAVPKKGFLVPTGQQKPN